MMRLLFSLGRTISSQALKLCDDFDMVTLYSVHGTCIAPFRTPISSFGGFANAAINAPEQTESSIAK
jgi:hypothetical protein